MKTLFTKLLIVVLCIIGMSNTIYPQTENLKRLNFTGGFHAAFLGQAQFKTISHSGTAPVRGDGEVFGSSGRGSKTFSQPVNLGISAGIRIDSKKRRHFSSIQAELKYIRNSVTLKYNGDTAAHLYNSLTNYWVETDQYFNCGISVQHYWKKHYEGWLFRRDVYRYVKASFGPSFHHLDLYGHPFSVNDAESVSSSNGDLFTAKTISVSVPWALGLEYGRRNVFKNEKTALDIGLIFNCPLRKTYTREFSVQHLNTKNNFENTGSGKYGFSGSSILFNLSYSFSSRLQLHEKEKPENTEKTNSLAENKFKDRKIQMLDSVTAESNEVTIQIWDKGKADGDRISLHLNGMCILDDYTVGKAKKSIRIYLKPGANMLVMHALNLGDIPPNTAAILIKTRDKKHLKMLHSDLKHSGAIKIYNESKSVHAVSQRKKAPDNKPLNASDSVFAEMKDIGLNTDPEHFFTLSDTIVKIDFVDSSPDREKIDLWLNGHKLLNAKVVSNPRSMSIYASLSRGTNYLVMRMLCRGVDPKHFGTGLIIHYSGKTWELPGGHRDPLTVIEITRE